MKKSFVSLMDEYMETRFQPTDTVAGIARQIDHDVGFWEKQNMVKRYLQVNGYIVVQGIIKKKA